METVKAIFIAPQCDPAWLPIPAEERAHYEALRSLVGGGIETVGLGEIVTVAGNAVHIYAVIHGEGLLVGLPPNIKENSGMLLAGNVVVVAEMTDSEGDTKYVDLPEDALEIVTNWLKANERPGRFDYKVPPPQILGGEDFDKYMRGEITLEKQVRVLGVDGKTL
jgi:hypothetical protein